MPVGIYAPAVQQYCGMHNDKAAQLKQAKDQLAQLSQGAQPGQEQQKAQLEQRVKTLEAEVEMSKQLQQTAEKQLKEDIPMVFGGLGGGR